MESVCDASPPSLIHCGSSAPQPLLASSSGTLSSFFLAGPSCQWQSCCGEWVTEVGSLTVPIPSTRPSPEGEAAVWKELMRRRDRLSALFCRSRGSAYCREVLWDARQCLAILVESRSSTLTRRSPVAPHRLFDSSNSLCLCVPFVLVAPRGGWNFCKSFISVSGLHIDSSTLRLDSSIVSRHCIYSLSVPSGALPLVSHTDCHLITLTLEVHILLYQTLGLTRYFCLYFSGLDSSTGLLYSKQTSYLLSFSPFRCSTSCLPYGLPSDNSDSRGTLFYTKLLD